MNGNEIIKLEGHIRDLASELNSNYPGAISDEKLEELVTKYVSLECSYDEAVKIVDSSLASLIEQKSNPTEAEQKFINGMLESYNNQQGVANPDKFFGDTINVQLVELFELLDQVQEKDFSLEGKILYFSRGRDEVLKKYKKSNKKSLDLENINYDGIQTLYNSFIRDVDIVVDLSDMRMDKIINSDENIFLEDGSINSNVYDFSNVEKVYDFALKHNKQIKLANLLSSNVVPKKLMSELENYSVEDRRKMILRFWDSYVSRLCMMVTQKGYDVRQIDAISNIVNISDSRTLYNNTLWNEYMSQNTNGDLYFIDFVKIVRKYFPDTELIYNESFEYIPEISKKVVTIVDYIKEIEKRDKIKLVDAIGLKSHYFDWSQELGIALSTSDVYDSMSMLFNLGLPLYRTEYEFDTNMGDNSKKDELVHAIRLTDQYCDVSGVILGDNKSTLIGDNYLPSDDYDYYADEFSVSRKKNKELEPEEEISKTMILKLMADEEAPSGYVLSNSLLVFIILVFAFIIILVSILLN